MTPRSRINYIAANTKLSPTAVRDVASPAWLVWVMRGGRPSRAAAVASDMLRGNWWRGCSPFEWSCNYNHRSLP
jgi:hypothetical protein